MSTRATYEFTANTIAHVPGMTFYIHHDGYPEGAAHYFRAALTYTNWRGGLPGQFVRANDNAEFTGHGMDVHGDTEFHWKVTPGPIPHLHGYHRTPGGSWQTCYVGPLLDFVNKHTATTQHEKLIAAPHGAGYLTANDLADKIADKIEHANAILAKGWTGNAAATATEAWRMIEALHRAWPEYEALPQCLRTLDRLDARLVEAYNNGWTLDAWRARFRDLETA